MGRTHGGGNGRISSSFLVVLLFVALVSQAADMATAQRDSPSGRGPSYFNPQSFNPSMAVIIVVLVTAFFFLGFFSIYLRRCAGSPLGPGPAGVGGDLLALGAGSGITFAAGAAAVRPRTPRGLDPAALRALPTMAYADVKAHRVGKGELECAVCLSEFDDRDALRLLPRCSHAFHVDCIDAWLASHVTCPVCRANLVFPEAPAPAPAPTVVQPQDVLPAAAGAAPEAVPTAPPEPVTTVAIAVDAEETEEERVKREEAAELVRIGSVKRALRSKSGRPPSPAQPVFPRSHTTGHSLAVAGGVAEERYTLRLPEHVLREAVAAGELRRTKSLQAFRDGTSGRSARRGFGFGFGGAAPRAGRSVRLGQSGRWPNMSALLASTFSSARLPAAWGASVRRGEADDAPGKVADAGGESNAAAGQRCDGGAGACPFPPGGGRV